MTPEKESRPACNRTANHQNSEETATRVATSTEADGLPPIVNLGDLLNQPEPTEDQRQAARAAIEAEENEQDEDYDHDAFMAYRNQVVRRWNEEDRKLIAYGKYIGAKMQEAQETWKESKNKDDRFKRKQQSWSEFFRIKETVDKFGSRSIVTLSEFRKEAKSRPRRKNVIEGVLKKQSKLIISSASKLGKTWILLDLAITAANGGSWLGFKVNKGRVLFVNFELHDDTFDERFDIMFEELTEDEASNLDILQLRGASADSSSIADLITMASGSKGYDLIIIDPLYKMLGDLDENSAEDMNKLMNNLERIAQDTGAAIAIVSHFTKGSSAKKQSGDRTSGSGVLARDPDAIIELVPGMGKEDDPNPNVDVHIKLREFSAIAPFVARMQGRILTRIEGEKVSTGSAAGRKPEFDMGEVLSLLSPNPLAHNEWEKAAKEIGVQKRQFDLALKKAKDEGYVHKKALRDPYSLTHEGRKQAANYQLKQSLKDGTHPKVRSLNPVECTHEQTGDGQTLTCSETGHTVEGHNETEAEIGKTLEFLILTMNEECSCGCDHSVSGQ